MLYEIQNVKQNEGEPKRRWFIDEYFDLVVWLDKEDEVEGFQLCYDKSKNQHALTWHRESGYMHNRVDEGDDKPGKPKGIPILVADGNFAYDKIAEMFKGESVNLDQRVAMIIHDRILEYSTRDSRADEDHSAIRQTVLDYIEGWYVGNAGRVERSLHPEMAKRRIENLETGKSSLEQTSAMTLIKETRCVTRTPKRDRQKDIIVLDVSENAASIKLVASDWVDYLHIAKFDGIWMIVNVLRESKAAPEC